MCFSAREASHHSDDPFANPAALEESIIIPCIHKSCLFPFSPLLYLSRTMVRLMDRFLTLPLRSLLFALFVNQSSSNLLLNDKNSFFKLLCPILVTVTGTDQSSMRFRSQQLRQLRSS